MAKINRRTSTPQRPAQPIQSVKVSDTKTFNGGEGFSRDPLSELFLLAVSNLGGEDTFYEKKDVRNNRFTDLVIQAVKTDPDWVRRFLPWLRKSANMRTASVMGSVDAAIAMLDSGIPGGRQIINSVLSRPDEPGEALAYARNSWGRLPWPVKRGIADAARRLYTEGSLLKYDKDSSGFRFGDVIELCHPAAQTPGQADLFTYAISRGKGRSPLEVPASLKKLRANALARSWALDGEALDSDDLMDAGMTWEATMSLTGGKVSKKEQWEQLIPTMDYMALLRNLRNFDVAGISRPMVKLVQDVLTDPDEVAKSRQFPLRFLSAVRAVHSLNWGDSLEQALELSLRSVPVFKGRTLVLVDTSGSMWHNLSDKSTISWADTALLFGLAVAKRCEAVDVVSFSDKTKVFTLKPGEAVLSAMKRWSREGCNFKMGTNTAGAVSGHFKGHDRVLILTDEQANLNPFGVLAAVPVHVPVITFNLAGYPAGQAPTGTRTRITIGGLTDAAFRLLPVLENHGEGQWPF